MILHMQRIAHSETDRTNDPFVSRLVPGQEHPETKTSIHLPFREWSFYFF